MKVTKQYLKRLIKEALHDEMDDDRPDHVARRSGKALQEANPGDYVVVIDDGMEESTEVFPDRAAADARFEQEQDAGDFEELTFYICKLLEVKSTNEE